MAVYKFKVTIDEDEDVTREIEIRSSTGFSTLHKAIVQHFHFRPGQEAEYYSSDQQWHEGDQIIKLDSEMKDVHRLADYIYDPHQRFICITESFHEVALMIELIRVSKEVDGVDYPRCVNSEGEPPYYTQPPLEHIADEEGEATIDPLLDLSEDGPSDAELEAAEAEAEKVDVEMPDMSALFKALAEDDQTDTSKEKDSKSKKEPKSNMDHGEFNMDDLT